VFSEDKAARLLAYVALKGVSDSDGLAATVIMQPRMELKLRPWMLTLMQRHAAYGHSITVLTGNLLNIAEPLCRAHGWRCAATVPELGADGCYTGRIAGPVFVGRAKVWQKMAARLMCTPYVNMRGL
jgi:phosphoserine phosphatase